MEEKKKYTWENYYKEHYYSHKEDYSRNMKKYLEKNKRHIIYKLVNHKNEVLYWGSTDSIFRICNHINGYSSLELSEEHWEELNCKCFEYAYVDAISDKAERLFIEDYLINKHRNNGKLLNSYNAMRKNGFDEMKKIELENIAERLEFKVFE